MLQHQTTHPDPEQLNRYVTGQLSSHESRFVGEHLDECSDCCQRIETLGITSSMLAEDGVHPLIPDESGSRTELMEGSVDLPQGGPEQAAHPGGPSRPVVPTRYEVLEQFAEGGMGVIYRAHDMHLERDVALKVLGEGRHPETRLRRFRAEAGVLGQLQHPGIPPVFDQGRLPDGRAFIAMKLIEGQTLAELLAQRTSPRSDLMHFLGVFKQICETVAFAHARGVLHRDLKPDNIMVGAFGEVQVMDWGLAKQLQRPSEHPSADFVSPEETATLPTGPARTMQGAVIGTPAYMPPEQAGVRSQEIDERADVFSLGAILCEILTGQPPYTGDSSSETFEQAKAAALDNAAKRLESSGADPRLIDLAHRCLSPDPADRIQSALEIAAEVEAGFESIQERLRDVELAQAREEGRRHRRRLQTMLVVVVSVCVTLLTGGWALVAHQNEVRYRRAVEQVSTALGEAGQLREQALAHPLESAAHWSAAREAIRLAAAVAAGTTDEDLQKRVRELSAQIEREAEAARRDQELVAQLRAADAPIALPDLPKMREITDRRDGPRGGRGLPFPPPHHHSFSDQFGGPPDRRPPPPEHRPGGDRRGPDPARHEEMQKTLARETSDSYVAALSGFDLDPRSVTAEQAARQINARPDEVRDGITAALDAWLSVLCDPLSHQPQYQEWVLEVLRGIDPDPERTAIRALVGAADYGALNEVAEDEALLAQSPAFILLVACQLEQPNDRIRLLREARARYPDSLLINQQLGEQLVRHERGLEATDAYMAALAIKPDAPTNVRVAMLLADHGRYDEAIALFRNAIRIDPHCTEAYDRLANVLTVLDRADEALAVVDDALARYRADDSDVWEFHVARGEAWEQLQEPQQALDAYRTALSLQAVPEEDRLDLRERVRELEAEVGR